MPTSDDEDNLSDVSNDPEPIVYTLPTTSTFSQNDYKTVSTNMLFYLSESVNRWPLS